MSKNRFSVRVMPQKPSRNPLKSAVQTVLGTLLIVFVSLAAYGVTRTIADLIPDGLLFSEIVSGIVPYVLAVAASALGMWCAFVALKFFMKEPPVKPLKITLGIFYGVTTAAGAFAWISHLDGDRFEGLLNSAVFLLFALTGFDKKNWDDLPPRR